MHKRWVCRPSKCSHLAHLPGNGVEWKHSDLGFCDSGAPEGTLDAPPLDVLSYVLHPALPHDDQGAPLVEPRQWQWFPVACFG